MKILVFGGKNGQVATCLSHLSDTQNEMQLVGRDKVDFAFPGQIKECVLSTDADAIINAVAYTAVDRAEEEPVLAEQINHHAVAEMGLAAALRSIPVLHLSTDYVFSGNSENPSKPDDLPDPLNVYGVTKLRGEQALQNAGGPYAILRTSWVFSAHGTNFVKSMLKLNGKVSIVNDQVGGPTCAADLANAALIMARLLKEGKVTEGIFHFTGAPDCTWAEFADAIFATAQRSVRVLPVPSADYPTLARRPRSSRLDCNSMTATLGIPRPEWRTGLMPVVREIGANT